MDTDKSCFFMICTNYTEKETIERGLMGDYRWLMPQMETIKKGDFGFQINTTTNELIGIFIAKRPARMNIVPDAWNGKFPAQIEVELLGNVQRVKDATGKLSNYVRMKHIRKNDPSSRLIPAQKAYDSDITKQVLALFTLPKALPELSSEEEDIGVHTEIGLNEVAGLEKEKRFIRQRILDPF